MTSSVHTGGSYPYERSSASRGVSRMAELARMSEPVAVSGERFTVTVVKRATTTSDGALEVTSVDGGRSVRVLVVPREGTAYLSVDGPGPGVDEAMRAAARWAIRLGLRDSRGELTRTGALILFGE